MVPVLEQIFDDKSSGPQQVHLREGETALVPRLCCSSSSWGSGGWRGWGSIHQPICLSSWVSLGAADPPKATRGRASSVPSPGDTAPCRALPGVQTSIRCPLSLCHEGHQPGLPQWLSEQRIRLQGGSLGFHPRVGKTPWRRKMATHSSILA